MSINPFKPDRHTIEVSIREDELRRNCILTGQRRNGRAEKIAESSQDIVRVDMTEVGDMEDVSEEQKEKWAESVQAELYDRLRK